MRGLASAFRLCPVVAAAVLAASVVRSIATAEPASSPPAARVVATAPRGQVAATTVLQVTFDRPVAAIGATEVSGFVITTEPKLEGRLRWAAPELLAFEPADLADAMRYTATLEWRGAGTCPVAGLPVRWTFETPGPELASVWPAERSLASRQPLVVELTQPVRPAAAAGFVQVLASTSGDDDQPAGDEQLVPIRVMAAAPAALSRSLSKEERGGIAGTNHLLALAPVGRWPFDQGRKRRLIVRLQPGLVGRLGPVPSRGGRLEITAPPDWFAVSSSCQPEGCQLGWPVNLELTSPIARAEMAKFRFEPRPAGLSVSLEDEYKGRGSQIQITGVFLAGTTYRATFAGGFRDVRGRSLGDGRPVTVELPFRKRPELHLSPSSGVFAVPVPPHAGTTTRFLSTLQLRAGLLSDADAARVLLGPARDDRDIPGLPATAATQTRTLHIGGPNGWAEELIDLDTLARGWRGMLALEARTTAAPDADGPAPQPELRYYQRTDVAPFGWFSGDRLAVIAVRHSDLSPFAGAAVSLFGAPGSAPITVGRTDGAGVLLAPVPSTAAAPVLMVKAGNDVEYQRIGSRRYRAEERGEHLRLHATLDRDLLRPGDAVHVVAWAILDAPDAPTGWRWLPAGTPVLLTLKDGSHNPVAIVQAKLDAAGKVWGELRLPAKVKLGPGEVEVAVGKQSEHLHVAIRDLQPPALELKLRAPSLLLRGKLLPLQLVADRLSGEPATLARLSFASTCRPVRRPFLLPLDSGWEIGVAIPHHASLQRRWSKEDQIRDGRWTEQVASAWLAAAAAPAECTLEVAATDLQREQVGESTTVFVHPAPAYVAVKTPSGLRDGERATVLVRLLDMEGRNVGGSQVTVVARGTGRVARCRTSPRAGEDVACELGPLPDGRYEVRATDDANRAAPVESAFHVLAKARTVPRPRAPQHYLDMELSRGEVSPGDELVVAVSSPTSGPGLLIVERSGIREQHAFTTRDGRATVNLRVKESWVPAAAIKIAQPVRSGDGRMTLHERRAGVNVSDGSRRLSVAIAAPSRALPGTRVPVELRVTQGGRPVAARLAVWAVDTAFLNLTGYRTSDPADRLQPSTRNESALFDPFEHLLRPFVPVGADPSLSVEAQGAIGRGGGSGSGYGHASGALGGRSSGARVRARFDPVPLFLGDVATDAMGKATVTLPLPDSLTRFRITALASAPMPDGNPIRFGMETASITVWQPLVLRAALPRLLRPGDRAEIGAVGRNLTGRDGVLTVSASLTSPGAPVAAAVMISEPSVRRELRQHEEIRLPFRIEARQPGSVQVELAAELTAAGDGPPDAMRVLGQDAVRASIAVEPEPATIDRAAAHVMLAQPATTALAIHVPGGTAPGGSLTLEASTSVLAEVLDAARYLVDYPHGCAEQTAGAILGLMASRELRRHGLSAPEVSETRLAERIERLVSMQTGDGGFAYWPGGRGVDERVSLYASWVLAQVRAAGVPVAAAVLERAAGHVAARLPALVADSSAPGDAAFALAVLAALGRPLPPDAVATLHARRAALDPFALASLVLALNAAGDARLPELLEQLTGQVLQTPGAARLPAPPSGAQAGLDPFASPSRTEALVALALLRARPADLLAAKLMRGLFDRRLGGAWRNTQENAFALLAALEQARREAVAGVAALRVTFDGKQVMQRELLPGSLAPPAVVPFGSLPAAGGELPLALELRRGGPVHVRAAAEWVLAAPAPRAEGVELERRIAAPRRGELVTVTQDANVTCVVQLRVRAPLRHLAVTVPLPAGLEGVTDLGRGQAARGGGPMPWWVSHHEIWKDRVLLYADRLEAGIHVVSLPLRAVTPGTYVLPAASAEAMYEPEIQARTGRGSVEVTPR